MYLYLRKYESCCNWSPDYESKKVDFYPQELAEFGKEVDDRNFMSKETKYQVGYWRKANAIHSWFVENCAEGVDNCRDIYVSKKMAQKLLDNCNEVLADKSLAKDQLPTQSGFFFGSQDYDDWYFEEIAYTKHILEKVLAFLETDKGKEYGIVYCASW